MHRNSYDITTLKTKVTTMTFCSDLYLNFIKAFARFNIKLFCAFNLCTYFQLHKYLETCPKLVSGFERSRLLSV